MEKLKQNGTVRQMNKVNGELSGSWYPKHRPLLHYRKRGRTTTNKDLLEDTFWMFNDVMIHIIFGTFWLDGYGYVILRKGDPVSFELNDVVYTLESTVGSTVVWKSDEGNLVWNALLKQNQECQPKPVYVKPLKMLLKPKAKQEDIIRGVISSFSGRAQIRPASTIVKPNYYPDTSQYLRSRGSSYLVNNVLSKVPGVDYVRGDVVVWPNEIQVVNGENLNSAVYKSCGTEKKDKCNRTIYKPNNSKYATQGAVTASARIVRLRAEAPEVRTNVSGKKMPYQNCKKC